MDLLILSDAAWHRIAPLIIGRPDQKGSTGRDNRMWVEGVLWRLEQRVPPVQPLERQSRLVADDPNFEYLMVDSTIARAHQHAAGAQKGGLEIRARAARPLADRVAT